MTHWQHYEHEADIGIEGIGTSKEDAFAQAALALTAVITEPENVVPGSKIEIACEAPNDELLFVDWLNALIYEMADRKMLFSRFDVEITSQLTSQPMSQQASQQPHASSLRANVWGEKIDQARHQPVVEIKGATYTTLQVYEDDDHIWHAQTVVDV